MLNCWTGTGSARPPCIATGCWVTPTEPSQPPPQAPDTPGLPPSLLALAATLRNKQELLPCGWVPATKAQVPWDTPLSLAIHICGVRIKAPPPPAVGEPGFGRRQQTREAVEMKDSSGQQPLSLVAPSFSIWRLPSLSPPTWSLVLEATGFENPVQEQCSWLPACLVAS